MNRKDGFIWACLGTVAGVPALWLLFDLQHVLKVTDERLTALGAVALVVATLFLVLVTELTRRSAERMAKFQMKVSARQNRKQTYSLKWMKEQETKPHCQFVDVLDTSTKTPIGVYLKNLGHGPALQMHWKFMHEGELIFDGVDPAIVKIAKKHDLDGWLEMYTPPILGANSQEAIFRLVDESEDEKNRFHKTKEREAAEKNVRHMILVTQIDIEFHSIMQQKGTARHIAAGMIKT